MRQANIYAPSCVFLWLLGIQTHPQHRVLSDTPPQVTVLDPEAYVFDEEVIKKAADLGKPGLVEIKQLQDRFIFRVEGTGVLPVSRGLGCAWVQGGVLLLLLISWVLLKTRPEFPLPFK